MSKERTGFLPDDVSEQAHEEIPVVFGEQPPSYIPVEQVIPSSRVLTGEDQFIDELINGEAARVVIGLRDRDQDSVAFIKSPRRIGMHVFPRHTKPVAATVAAVAAGAVGIYVYKKVTARSHPEHSGSETH